MPNEQLSIPLLDEIEVSFFGPGYGESVAIHVGNKFWILVDSCLDPKTRQPAGLNYLQQLGVDIQQSVKLVVATHWHDDHVRGLSSVFKECNSAHFVLSSALHNHEFVKLLSLYEPPHMIKSSGVDQFVEIFKLIEERRKLDRRSIPLKWAGPDRTIYSENVSLPNKDILVSVHTLSPSDVSILNAYRTFSSLLQKENQPKKRVPLRNTNEFAVALWLEINDHKILLGADLKNTGQSDTGWAAIVDNSIIIRNKRAAVFKVPHHGSQSGHNDRVWSSMVEDNVLAFLSSFNRGTKPLPSEADLKRIVLLTSKAYLTAPPKSKRHKFSDPVVRDMVKDITQEIYSINQGWGQIRLRGKILGPSNEWDVKLYGDAYKIGN